MAKLYGRNNLPVATTPNIRGIIQALFTQAVATVEQ